MFRRFASRAVLKSSALMVASLLAACSSSPSHEEKPADITQAPAASGASTPDLQGPPPIPQEATLRFENALTLMGAGDYSRAELEFKQLADAYPEYGGALVNLGILYLKTGKTVEAERALKAAIARSPTNAAAYNQLGIVYRRLGRFKEADAAYSKAIEIDPNYALAYLNLGVLCDLYLQQPERALAAFERYTSLAPKPDARVASWMKELQGRVKPQRSEGATP